MATVSASDQEYLKNIFKAQLVDDVRLIHFTRPQPLLEITGQGQHSIKEASDLIELVAGFSDKITAEIHNIDIEGHLAKEYGVDKVPGTAIVGSQDYGLRHYGIPGGRQFASFIQAIVDVSKRTGGVSQATKDAVQVANSTVHLQVFVSPGWATGPTVASWAYKLAVESPYVTADVVELPEFNELKDKYAVALVPKVVINESVPYEGPWVAQNFLQAVVAQWSGDKAEESEE